MQLSRAPGLSESVYSDKNLFLVPVGFIAGFGGGDAFTFLGDLESYFTISLIIMMFLVLHYFGCNS